MDRLRVFSNACLAAGLVLVCGCKSARKAEPGEQAGTSTVTSAAIRHSVDDASQRVATARCDQELACAHDLGSAKREADKTECLDRVKSETAKELSPEACPKGIDHDRLVHCVGAMEQVGCDDPVSRLMQLEDCRKSRLCIR
jgi:hypothetical protein